MASAPPGHLRVALVASVGLAVTACATTTPAPSHGGYRSNNAHPWTRARALPLDDKLEAHTAAQLDYAAYRRARWFAVELPAPGRLDVALDVTPGEERDEPMDVGLEVLDPRYQVLTRSDLDAADAHELRKERSLAELAAGRYLVHVYLQGRLDSADVDLAVHYTRQEPAADYRDVPFLGRLAAIPVVDDAPAPGRPRPRPHPHASLGRPAGPRPDPGASPGPDPGIRPGAVVVGLSNVESDGHGGVRITITGGTADGLADGMTGTIQGVRGSRFTLRGCTASTCQAVVHAAADDIRAAGRARIQL